MNFKAGDIVKLKSGGPSMTITEVNSGDARCVYFLDKKLEYASLPVISLVPAPSPK